MTAPKVGALFAGYGGLELAVREVFPSASPAWLAEFDAAPSRILAQRFPDVPNLGDVTAVDWAAVEPVDIITGGSPCQDLSHAGKRAGMRAGTRSGLWASMCDAIEIIRPRLVVWENVRGALSAEADSAVEPCPICVGDGGRVSLRALGRVLGDLAELGYDAAWCGLRAADVGAPHGRFRVFVLAWDATGAPGLDGRPAVPHADGAARGERWLTAPGEAQGGRARSDAGRRGGAPAADGVSLLPTPQAMDTAGAMADRRSTSGYGPALRDITALLPTPAVNDMGAGKTVEDWDAWTDRMKAAHGNGNGHGKSLSFDTQRLAVAGQSLSRDFGSYAPAIARWEAVLGRPAPAPTDPTGKGGAHRLSPRFVEWLMGLPDGWVTGESVEAWRARLADRRAGRDARPVGHRGSVARRLPVTSRNEQLKALGNGVVPQQAAAAVRHLLAVRAAALAGQAVAA